MLKNYLLGILCVLYISGCKKAEDTEPDISKDKSLIVNVAVSYETALTDNWIFIHDAEGKIIDFKTFEAGDKLEFKSSKLINNKVTVTNFSRSRPNQSYIYNFHTDVITNVDDEINLSYRNTSVSYNNKGGTFKLNVKDLPGHSITNLSNPIFSAPSQLDPINKSLNFTGLVIPDIYNDAFLYAYDGKTLPRYKIFKELKDNDIINTSYNVMSNFNKNIVVKFPETTFGSVFYEVRSLQTDPKSQHSTYKNATNSSFEFNRNLGMANSLTSSITLGYLDEFKNYETRFFVGDGNQTYYYFKRGAAPNSIVLPLTSKFTILDKTFDNFDFNAIGNFVSKSVSWHYYDPNPTPNFYFSWSVSSTPDYKQKLFELPSEFKKKYPVIQLEKLALVGASFIVKRSYDPKLDEYEEYSVSTW